MRYDNLRPPDFLTASSALSLSKPISMSWSRSEAIVDSADVNEVGEDGVISKIDGAGA
jgi:hypothetical protein